MLQCRNYKASIEVKEKADELYVKFKKLFSDKVSGNLVSLMLHYDAI